MVKLSRGAARIAIIVASTGLGFGLYAAVFLASSGASAAQLALSREFDAAAMALIAGLSDRPAGLAEFAGVHEDDETNRAELRRFERLSPLLWYGGGDNPATRLAAAYGAWRRAGAAGDAAIGEPADERDAAALALASAYIEAGDLLDRAGARVRISFDLSFLFLSFLLSLGAAAGVSMLARLREARLKERLAHETYLRALRAEEETRKLVAMELHDDLAQDVAAAKMLCERAAASRETALAARAAGILGETNKKIRRLSSELRPPELDALGLGAALKAICDEVARRFDFELRYEGPRELRRFNEEIELGVYRIMREAASNAAKYATGGGTLHCELRDEPGGAALCVSLRDGGRADARPGSSAGPSAPPAEELRGAGLGLNAMKERAKAIGAELSVDLRPSGSSVVLRLSPAGLKSPPAPGRDRPHA